MWVIYDWSDWGDIDALTVTHFALAPLIVEKVGAHGHDLSLEKVSDLAPELSPTLSEVQRLGQICGNLERERDGLLSNCTNISREALDHLGFLPGATLHNVGISLAFVTVVDFLARVNELQLELDAIGGDRLVCINVNHSFNGVICVERALIIDESHFKFGSIERGFCLTHYFVSNLSKRLCERISF